LVESKFFVLEVETDPMIHFFVPIEEFKKEEAEMRLKKIKSKEQQKGFILLEGDIPKRYYRFELISCVERNLSKIFVKGKKIYYKVKENQLIYTDTLFFD